MPDPLADTKRSTRRPAAAVLLAVALLAVACRADRVAQPDPEPVDTDELIELTGALVDAGLPGVVVLVEAPDFRREVRAGVADRSTGTAIDADSRFNIGDAANAYVAAALLALQSDGAVALGTSVETFLPGRFARGHDTAIYDLLQHTSGIPDFLGTGDERGTVVESCLQQGRCGWSDDALLDLAAGRDARFQAGEGWGFSNSNYLVAAEVLESITGRAWPEAIDDRILGPLGLTDTAVPDQWTTPPGRSATGYSDIDGDGQLDDVTAFLPGGGGAGRTLFASPNDVMGFFRPLLRGDLLSPDAQTALFAVAPTGFGVEEYGMGVSFPCGFAAQRVGQSGEALGYSTFVEHDLRTDTTVVVMANQSGALPAAEWGALINALSTDDCQRNHARPIDGPVQLRLFCLLAPDQLG